MRAIRNSDVATVLGSVVLFGSLLGDWGAVVGVAVGILVLVVYPQRAGGGS